MKLYQRLGINKNDLDVKESLRLFEKTCKLMKTSNDVPNLKGLSVNECQWIVLEYYLLDETVRAKQYIHELISLTKEYFWGDWRSQYDISESRPANPKTWKTVETWTDEFRYVISWASCINEWKNVYEFAGYPNEDCPLNRYEPRREGVWFLLLAAALRGEKTESLDQYAEMIKNGKQNKYQKLLLNMLYAILDGDSASFNKELNAHLKYCDSHLFNSRDPRNKVTMDGTFLINYARHKGLTVKYAPEYEDRIIKL